MPSVIVFAQLNTAGGTARQKVIDGLTSVSVYSKQNEPEVVRYAICLPRDASDENSVFVIEEYASQSAMDTHMAAKPTTDLISYFTANPTFFSGAPDVAITESSSSFVRSEIIKANDPYITYATITYKEGTREGALGGWKTVTSETQNKEPETLSYGIAKDKDSELVVRTLEVYANENYFRNVHAPSKAVAENKAKYGDQIRTSIKFAFLKFVGGYLHKDPASPNL